ncbi:hypothetical protein K7432_011203 [Basidiobolus ranarum]|uniref:RING-type domain-containing protein n=1 Tax=Basidiobolus ranarum TaxID=34480 RepID=A0ABR2VUA6_9FUNG
MSSVPNSPKQSENSQSGSSSGSRASGSSSRPQPTPRVQHWSEPQPLSTSMNFMPLNGFDRPNKRSRLGPKPESSSKQTPDPSLGTISKDISNAPPSESAYNIAAKMAKYEIDKIAKDNDFLCPICLQVIKEAFMTRCGHSFCYLCIVEHLEHKQDCPTCKHSLNRDQIYPNFLLNRFLEKTAGTATQSANSPLDHLKHSIMNDDEWGVDDLNQLMTTLLDKKCQLESQKKRVEYEILLDFLQKAKSRKEESLSRLQKELQFINDDIGFARNEISSLVSLQEIQTDANEGAQVPIIKTEDKESTLEPKKRSYKNVETLSASAVSELIESMSNVQDGKSPMAKFPALQKKRVSEHFDDLQECYFGHRFDDNGSPQSLTQFTSTLSKFTRYSSFRELATLRYGDIFNTSSIVSSIEFDRDDEYFATAGVTKKIKIFEFGNLASGVAGRTTDTIDWGRDDGANTVMHYPIREMVCRSKISCLSWNPYIKSQIVSSDYEGIVMLWDVNTGTQTRIFDEHEKRAWSVDFSKTDPTRLASGSDDTKVKIWSTNQKKSVMTIESKANICCVKFNPESSYHVAFGSADHHIHYYDIRNRREPLMVFKGHRKAVSYVKFMGMNEVVSASTDSTLKLWNTGAQACTRTFSGHVNEKNFVGLAVNGDWISCGSENNSVYTYFKNLKQPVVTVKFKTANPVTGEPSTDEDPSQFVSSVCWKKNSNVMLAANSQGTIKVLELV